jgi:hypothetical protein
MVLACALAACGDGMQGRYKDDYGMGALTFDGDGKVVQSSEMAGVEVEMEYEVDGDRIRLSNPQAPGATLVLTRIDSETLSGPMGIKYRRQSP